MVLFPAPEGPTKATCSPLFTVKFISDKAPDFGIGKGVITSQLVKLDDDDQVAAMQMVNMGEKLIKDNIKVNIEKITQEDWDKAEDE